MLYIKLRNYLYEIFLTIIKKDKYNINSFKFQISF